MEAIREIREIDSNQVVIDIPDEFRKRKIEIIVMPIDDTVPEKSKRFSRFLKKPIKIENFHMPSRDERNAR